MKKIDYKEVDNYQHHHEDPISGFISAICIFGGLVVAMIFLPACYSAFGTTGVVIDIFAYILIAIIGLGAYLNA